MPAPEENRVEIGLLRHFPTCWNAEGRLQGRSDIPLAPESVEELTARRLPPRWRAASMHVSPLSRAAVTAQALNEGAPIRFDERLVEMSFGDWEGMVVEDLIADPGCIFGPVETWGWDMTPPGGESPAMMLARLRPALAEVAAQAVAQAVAGPALLVCHRGVMRAILAAASGWDYRGPERFRIKRAAIHPVTITLAGDPVAFGAPEKLEFR